MPRDDVAVLVFSSRRGRRGEAMAGESVDIRMAWDAPSGGGSSSQGCADDAGDGDLSSQEWADDVGDGGWSNISTEVRREYDDH